MSYVCDRVFANKCLNCQPCIQFIFSPRCESDMILSVMTYTCMHLQPNTKWDPGNDSNTAPKVIKMDLQQYQFIKYHVISNVTGI